MKQKLFMRHLVLSFVGLLAGIAGSILPDLAFAQQKSALGKQQRAFPRIAEATKQGYQKVRSAEGKDFLTLYHNPKKHSLLAEIPHSLQKQPFLLATSITGGRYTGWQWNDLMVYWERYDRRLLLVEPEIRYRAQGGTIAEVVKRTYRDRVITTVPIMAVGPSGSLLIDLTSLFAGKSRIFIGSLSGGADSSLAKVTKVKAFPDNVEIQFDMPGSGRARSSRHHHGGGPSGGLAVHYSISRLPKTRYKPCIADDRIGYFLTAHKDFSKSPREQTMFVRYINRWHIEKDDPNSEISLPKDPIVFYVEKTVPVRYRRYIHEGILEWNKAFEKIGILKAIEVRQQTATNEFKNHDPEDVRYNFFRWVTSDRAFAMGPSRVHPETGQILDADIIFDESMIRDWLEEYSRLIVEGPMKELHPSLRRYLSEYPHRHPMRRWRDQLEQQSAAQGDPEANPPDDLVTPEDFADHKGTFCDYGHGMRHQLNFGLTVLTVLAENRKEQPSPVGPAKDGWPEEYIGQILKEVVMHEVGHTLGLRHNFKASSWLSLEEINNPEKPVKAITGSVMDYNPVNISPHGKPQGVWNTRTIGPYDFWAIEYGYTLKNDPKELAKIASRVAEKGLAYATDEDVMSSDPYVSTYDMGNDPLAFARQRGELVQQTLRSLIPRVVKPGQSYQRVRQAFNMLLYEYAKSSWIAASFVGGHHLRRDHKGDPGERLPIEPVDIAKQREALDLVCESMFGRKAFRFSPELLNRLAVGRWRHWGSTDLQSVHEFPIHERILQLQYWSLFDLLNPRTLTLVSDAELRIGDDQDALTIPELFSKVTQAIWTEVMSVSEGSAPVEEYTNRKPFIDSIRRNLQHEYVAELIGIALERDEGPSPQSAQTQAWYQLSQLSRQIDQLSRKTDQPLKLDDYSRAHLEETSKRIKKALEASYSRNGGGGTGG